MPNVNPMASMGKPMISDVMSDGQQWATGSKIPSGSICSHLLEIQWKAVENPMASKGPNGNIMLPPGTKPVETAYLQHISIGTTLLGHWV